MVWADVQVVVIKREEGCQQAETANQQAARLLLIPKNANRAWLAGMGPRERTNTLAWAGRPPAGFAALRAWIFGRMRSAHALRRWGGAERAGVEGAQHRGAIL